MVYIDNRLLITMNCVNWVCNFPKIYEYGDNGLIVFKIMVDFNNELS